VIVCFLRSTHIALYGRFDLRFKHNSISTVVLKISNSRFRGLSQGRSGQKRQSYRWSGSLGDGGHCDDHAAAVPQRMVTTGASLESSDCTHANHRWSQGIVARFALLAITFPPTELVDGDRNWPIRREPIFRHDGTRHHSMRLDELQGRCQLRLD
jgi:hypothetical protein